MGGREGGGREEGRGRGEKGGGGRREIEGGREGERRDGRGREALTHSLHSTADGSCDIILPLTESELRGCHVPETNT